jgi:hypothetical protein
MGAFVLSSCKPATPEDKNPTDCVNKGKSGHSLASSKDSSGKDDKDDKDKDDKDKPDCDTDDGDDESAGGGGNAGNPPIYTFPDYPGRVCTIDKFKQNSQQDQVKKVDILFVMDHSGSMRDDWERVANNVRHMVKELPADLDINYSVLLANGAGLKGKLFAGNGVPVVISSKTNSVNKVASYLQRTFTAGMQQKDDVALGEAPVLSLYHAVTTHARANQKLGFFRPDAALSIIFMSDEQEVGFPFPDPQAPGLPPRCDAATEDAIKREQYDKKGINLDLAYNATKALKGDMPILTSAFVNITKEDLFRRNSKNSKCLYDSLGYGYFELVDKTKGVLFSIQQDKAEGLARCGKVLRERLALMKDFPLSKPADKVDVETITAAVDGAKAVHTYKVASNSVHLDFAGNYGSEIEIQHCEPVEQKEWSIQGFTGQAAQYAAGLSWKTPEYATNGKVVYGTSATNLNKEVAATGVNTDHVVTVEGLAANTLYYFQAVNKDDYGLEKRSAVISLRTQPDWSISSTNGEPSRNSVNIRWNTVQYPTVGKVFYGTSADALVNESAETAAVTSHGVMISGLNANTNYFFRCVSKDEYGLEKKSEIFSVQTLSEWGLVGFKGVAAKTSVVLDWQTPGYNTNGKIRWGTSAGSLTNELASVALSENHTVTVTGLNPNTTYYFQAVNSDDLGLVKQSDVIAVKTLVDWNITGFSGTSTQNSVSVGWSTLEYATNGKVFWGSTAESLSNELATNGPVINHSATITGLTPDTVYYFRAVASDEFGNNKASGVVAIKTQAIPKPVWEMTDFTGLATKNSVSVGWKTSAYATTGKILWGTSENSLTNELSEGAAFTNHALLVNGLTPDTLYYFQAVSIDDFGQEKRTAVIAVRTLVDDVVDPNPIPNWEIVGFDVGTQINSADVIWRTPGAVTKATIKYGTNAQNLNQVVEVTEYLETHIVNVEGLTESTTYYFQVIAVDKNGRTVESVIVMKRTKAL